MGGSDPAPPPRRQRIGLSKTDLATEVGQTLLNLLDNLVSDGALTDGEIKDLAAWLERTASTADLPGLHFLREEVAGVLADGKVSDGERRLLQTAILRVLPVTERERAKARISDRHAAERKAEQARWTVEQDAPTDSQRDYIRALGGTCPDSATRGEASQLIDSLLANRPTARQRMVLRFWNRLDLMHAGVDGVSAWMDRWYAEDPYRLEAWILWKREVGDAGDRSAEGVDRVPLGAGQEYLARVKVGAPGAQVDRGENSQPVRARSGGCLGQIVIACLSLLAIPIAILWICQ